MVRISVEALPIELWMDILDRLSHADWLRLEAASQFLRSVSLQKWKKVKHFDFKPHRKTHFGKKEHFLPKKAINGMWSHCGGTVESLTFGSSHFTQESYSVDETINIWAALASAARKIAPKQLKSVDFKAFSLRQVALGHLKTFVKAASRLETLNFSNCFSAGRIGQRHLEKQAQILSDVLLECKNLKNVYTLLSSLPHTFLAALPDTVGVVEINEFRLPFPSLSSSKEPGRLDPHLRNQFSAKHLFSKTRTELHSLELRDCDRIAYDGITCHLLSKRAPNLEFLLIDTKDSSVEDLIHLAPLRLRRLDVTGMTATKSTGFAEVVAGWTAENAPILTTLVILSLTKTKGLKEKDVRSIAAFSNLKELELDTPALSLAPLVSILRSCRWLEYLWVNHSANFNNACLQAVGEHAQSLRRLELNDVSDVSSQGFKQLEQSVHLSKSRQHPLEVYWEYRDNRESSEFKRICLLFQPEHLKGAL